MTYSTFFDSGTDNVEWEYERGAEERLGTRRYMDKIITGLFVEVIFREAQYQLQEFIGFTSYKPGPLLPRPLP